MTDQQDTTPVTHHQDAIAERERLAAEAFTRIRHGNHWRDWRYLAEGFELGRNHAMRAAHINEPAGRGYNEAFGRWMDEPSRRTWTRGVDKATRNHLLWCADHLSQIEAWRETLAPNQRDAWNHPTTIKKAFERMTRVIADKKAGVEQLSPMAQMKAALVESQTDAAAWKRRAMEGGSLFDLRRDTARDIARLIVDSCTPSRVEGLIRALKAEVKDRSTHAG